MSRKGVVEIEIICKLDPEDLKPWDELTPEQQKEQESTDPSCAARGDFGGLCINCHFCLDWEMVDSREETLRDYIDPACPMCDGRGWWVPVGGGRKAIRCRCVRKR